MLNFFDESSFSSSTLSDSSASGSSMSFSFKVGVVFTVPVSICFSIAVSGEGESVIDSSSSILSVGVEISGALLMLASIDISSVLLD